jgi:hypothetical protein
MGGLKEMARTMKWLNKPIDLEEFEKYALKMPQGETKDKDVKFLEELKRDNSQNVKLDGERDAQEREKWK